MTKISKWVISSKSFFWVALALMVIISTITIGLFILNVYKINGVYFNQLQYVEIEIKIKLWTRIWLTSIGSTLAVLSLLLVNRHNANFFYFGVTSTVLLAINGVLSNLLFDAIKWLCVGTVLSIQAIIWNLNRDNEINLRKINNGPLSAMIVTILIISTIISFGVVIKIPDTSLFYNKKPILDPIQFGFTIVGNILAIFYFIESRIIYMIGNTLTLLMFIIILSEGEILSLIQLTQSSLYLLITVSGYVHMLGTQKQKEKITAIENGICIGPHCNFQ